MDNQNILKLTIPPFVSFILASICLYIASEAITDIVTAILTIVSLIAYGFFFVSSAILLDIFQRTIK